MANGPTFNTLADVQAWLVGLTAGQSVQLGAANFAPPIAAQVFTVVAGADPLVLTVSAATTTPEGGILTGAGEFLDEPDSSVTLQFGAGPDDPLLVTIEATLPPALAWKPVMGFQFVLGDLVVTVSPEPSVGTANFGTTGLLLVEGQPPLDAQLTLPAVAGAEWALAASGPAEAAPALLCALAGGADPLAILGSGFDAQDFTVSSYELAFAVDGTASMFKLSLDYPDRWLPLGTTVFELSDMTFEFIGHAPFRTVIPPTPQSQPPSPGEKLPGETITNLSQLAAVGDLQALATATLMLDGSPVPVSIKFPDAVVFAALDPRHSPSVRGLFSGFHIRLPAGFPDADPSSVSFGLYALDRAIDLMICIDSPVPITDSIYFDNFHFDLVVDCRAGVFSGRGEMFAQFTFGTGKQASVVALEGPYEDSGYVRLRGSVSGFSVRETVAAIVAQFNIDHALVPAIIYGFTLNALTIVFKRSERDLRFDFFCDCVEADFLLAVGFQPATKSWEFEFVPPNRDGSAGPPRKRRRIARR